MARRSKHLGVERLPSPPPTLVPAQEDNDDERLEAIWLMLGRAAQRLLARRAAEESQAADTTRENA